MKRIKKRLFWSMSWEKNSVENVILFCFTEDEGLCRYEEFFDGWWNNVQVFVDKKKWNEKIWKIWRMFLIDDDIMYMFSLANMNLHEVQFCHAKVLSYFINMFIEHGFRMWWYESGNIIPVTWRFLRYTTFYAMC